LIGGLDAGDHHRCCQDLTTKHATQSDVPLGEDVPWWALGNGSRRLMDGVLSKRENDRTFRGSSIKTDSCGLTGVLDSKKYDETTYGDGESSANKKLQVFPHIPNSLQKLMYWVTVYLPHRGGRTIATGGGMTYVETSPGCCLFFAANFWGEAQEYDYGHETDKRRGGGKGQFLKTGGLGVIVTTRITAGVY